MPEVAQPSTRRHGNEASQALAFRTPCRDYVPSSESYARMSQRMNRAVSCESVNPFFLYIHERGVPVAPSRRQFAKNLRCVRTEQVNSLEMRCVEQSLVREIPKINAVSRKAYRSVNARFV